jgi:putative DNA primase/helicase
MRLSVETLKEFAIGRWPEIIATLAPHLSLLIKRGKRHGPCPFCGGKDRARCHNDFAESGGIFCNVCKGGADGFAVLQWANSWTFPESLRAVTNYLGLVESAMPTLRYQTPQLPSQKDWKRERKQLGRIWAESQPGARRLRQYFEFRGLCVMPPDTLRLHPSLEYWNNGKSYGKFPCMVAMITRGGELVGIHRTFLDSDGPGKAPVLKSKRSNKCVDTISGGAIQLYAPELNQPLALAEGIESALAVHEITGLPAWSCINSTMLGKAQLPDSINCIIIGADKDRSRAGQKSADNLARRLVDEGREVKISLPPMSIPAGSKSVDWLDYHVQEVPHA